MEIDTSLDVVVNHDADLALRDGPHTWFVRSDDKSVIYG